MQTNYFPALYFGASKKALAIVDDYSGGTESLDKTKLAYTSHANIVKASAKSVYPEIKLRDYKTEPLDDGLSNPIPALEKLLKDIENGIQIGAVNISMGEMVKIQNLGKQLGIKDLNVENLSEYRKQIKDNLHRFNFSASEIAGTRKTNIKLAGKLSEVVTQVISFIEKITSHGIPVYIAAGNHGVEALNLFLLADGAIGVGGLNSEGKPASYRDTSLVWSTGNNDLVTEWAPGQYTTVPVFNTKGDLAGFSLQQEGNIAPVLSGEPHISIIDVELHTLGILKDLRPLLDNMTEVSENPFKDVLSDMIQAKTYGGTSTASPKVAAEYLLNQDD